MIGTLVFKGLKYLLLKMIYQTHGEALISSLFKQGKKDRNKAKNYRPVRLTSISCKVLEHVLHINIMKHLKNNNMLTNLNNGFRKYRSCETNLIKVRDDFAKSINHDDWCCWWSTLSLTMRLFSDDAFIYRIINDTEDRQIFQEDLDKLIQWEQAWKMKFNKKWLRQEWVASLLQTRRK